MIFRSGRFRKPLTVISVFSFVAICHGEPDAEAILRAARLNPVGQKISLAAQLRTGSINTPFEIIVDEAIRYHFENPEQELILELREDSSSLSERVGGKTAPVKPARYDDPVRNTGITYEDLFLRFLYWKRPKLLGEDTIRSRRAWKIELQAWGTSSQYGVARLWIDQESGALLRIEGYNREGKLLRRFEVISAQKIDGQWMLKQMRVETLDPDSGKIRNRTYLEVLGKSAVTSKETVEELTYATLLPILGRSPGAKRRLDGVAGFPSPRKPQCYGQAWRHREVRKLAQPWWEERVPPLLGARHA